MRNTLEHKELQRRSGHECGAYLFCNGVTVFIPIKESTVHNAVARLTIEGDGWLEKSLDPKATPNDPRRVFTEAEVKALYRDLYSAAMDGPYLPNVTRMDECLAKHGITL